MQQQRLFEDLIESDVVSHGTNKSLTLPVSIAAHVVIVLAVLIIPLFAEDPLPEPAAAVRAFFVAPPPPAPPPPPPPPPKPKRARPKAQPKPRPVIPDVVPQFTAPVEIPEEIVPEEGIDIGFEEGGVEGGVPGGIVGGVVGGLPDAPPPPKAIRVGGNIKEPNKVKHVAPTYPDIARQARVQGIVILECTISPQGRVSDVKVLRGIPLLDQAAIDAVKQWIYTPTLLNGVPVPVIMTVTVNFKFQ